ncbi:hypothetical protein DFH08DRAFT_1054705 [Mycena albidolilacea]|uniref:Uncharacterized protein n=1 Tax=Mycena albidolilacea TaxID=1033008 RepID=A0AAD6Z3R5_9AGAR|nr:hypothetical protein DFH08DRAFT_1054705 [Mycena albidolilacea]
MGRSTRALSKNERVGLCTRAKHWDRLPPHPLAPPAASLPQTESLCPESLSLPLPLGEGETRAEEAEAREEYDHRWRGVLAPHVGVAGGPGAGAGAITTHTSSTVSLFPPLPLPFLLGVLKTVALPIGFGFGFVFIPHPLAKEEGEGDLAQEGEEEEQGARVQGEWDARRERGSTANASLYGDARGRGCQPVYRSGPAIGAEHVDAANAELGSGRGEGGKLHFSSAGDIGEEGEDGTHATSGDKEETSEGTPCVSAGKRLCGEGESSAASRSLESDECEYCEEEGEGVPNGAYAVQSLLQGVLSASVGSGVFGGARVLERDRAGDAGMTASVYEWQYAEEVTIGGGGGARVGMLARTAGLRRTEGVGIIADSRRSARSEGRGADMGNDSQEGGARKNGGSGGGEGDAASRVRGVIPSSSSSVHSSAVGSVEAEATGCGGGGTGDTARLTIASGVGEGEGVRASHSAEGAGTAAGLVVRVQSRESNHGVPCKERRRAQDGEAQDAMSPLCFHAGRGLLLEDAAEAGEGAAPDGARLALDV